MNPDDLVTSRLDGIPIVGHIKALMYINQRQTDFAVTAFSAATHKTGVICFGILGGHLAGTSGSSVGGVIGGLFVDIPISLITSTRHEYVDYFIKSGSWNMIANDWTRLMYSVHKDAFIGIFASIACNNYKIPMMLWNNHEKPEIKYYNTFMDEIKKETDYRDLKISAKLLITAMNARFALTKLLIADLPVKIPVANIVQLASGDHIVYERDFCGLYVYDHHAIVDQVFPDENMYSVYEQAPFHTPNELMSRGKAWIQWNEKRFSNVSIYRIDHGKAALPNYIVWKNAEYIFYDIRSFKKKYNVVFNNCEHFANFCATDVRESQQVQQTTVNVLPFILSGIILVTRNVYPVNLLMS